MHEVTGVNKISDIKRAISQLSPREYCELMADLFPSEDDEWDKQMKADVAAGKLDWLIKETQEAILQGKTISVEKAFAKPFE